jgi:hypothetical protein
VRVLGDVEFGSSIDGGREERKRNLVAVRDVGREKSRNPKFASVREETFGMVCLALKRCDAFAANLARRTDRCRRHTVVPAL